MGHCLQSTKLVQDFLIKKKKEPETQVQQIDVRGMEKLKPKGLKP
jgi:hypothetical protein